LNRRNEPVSLPRHSFDKPRVSRFVSKHLPDLLDRGIQAVIELDEGVVRPEALLQLLPRPELRGPFQQQ
jgi:hypothetical protein